MAETAEDRKARLDSIMADEQAYAERKATLLHYFSLIAQTLAVGASVIAAVLGLLKVNPQIVGVLALLPALVAYGVTSLKFDEKSFWHYDKAVQLRVLRTRLNFGTPIPYTWQDIDAIAAKRDELQLKKAQQRVGLTPDWFGLGKGFKSQSNESLAAPAPVPPNPEAK